MFLCGYAGMMVCPSLGACQPVLTSSSWNPPLLLGHTGGCDSRVLGLIESASGVCIVLTTSRSAPDSPLFYCGRCQIPCLGRSRVCAVAQEAGRGCQPGHQGAHRAVLSQTGNGAYEQRAHCATGGSGEPWSWPRSIGTISAVPPLLQTYPRVGGTFAVLLREGHGMYARERSVREACYAF